MKPFRTHGAAEWGEEPSPSRSVSTASGSTCSDGVPAVPPWWTLVWCHERCHKQGCDGERAAITDTVQDAGATLVCLKKATRFSSWMKQAGQSPYGLLTDWREAKPCMEAIETCSPSDRPAFLVVYCELPRCRERATAWASARPCGATPVPHPRRSGPPVVLPECLGRQSGSRQGPARPPQCGALWRAPVWAAAWRRELARPAPRRPGRRGRRGRGPPPGGAVREDEEEPRLDVAAVLGQRTDPRRGARAVAPSLQACGVVPAHFQQAPLQPVAAGCVYVRVECAEAPAVQGRGSQQIEAMLVSAMPDHYDD
ncbi:unnamed protein product [Prorocentrum cordatum]|uniref:Uncharacterized protein n=1 Tax=Prorocentrum cordatum TaxID=2364126 RepID=A0ABN9V891_9DINO|nr:unnamed protein product [Polarella glacialis]